jgi:hypothetical protein
MKIINNCLNKEELINLQNLMMSNMFPWFITKVIEDEKNNDYQFTHNFYKDYESRSTYFNLLNPLLNILNPASLIRIKANLLIKENKIIKHGFHVDTNLKNSKTAIFYVNTNNGFTEFKNKKIVKSEENKLIVFDNNIEHTGTTCTDEFFRIVINFNYF